MYEKLFDLLSDHKSFYERPEVLRHPLIFYYGHTAVLYINKAIEAELLSERINPKF